LGCHPTFNDAYELQPAPRNGRAQYATRDGAHFLYWTPSGGTSGSAEWLLDVDTDDAHTEAYLMSSAETPPTGSAVWGEWCSGQWTTARLRLAPGALLDAAGCAAALGALAPRLTSTCCGPEDGSGCGRSGAPPSACSVDCAHFWAPHARQCPAAAAADMGDPALTAFFGGECGAAAAGLAVLSDTATIQEHQTHDFAFEARSGVRYQVDVRVGEGSDRSVPCTGNHNDDVNGAGGCDGLISGGSYSCVADLCATCGANAHQCDLSCGLMCTEDGVTSTTLRILPPGATDNSQAVAEASAAADMDLSFTAAATGTFTVRVRAFTGSGPVAVTGTAIGTATERSPRLVATGSPRPLTVSCQLNNCAFGYDGAAALDGDGSGFDLLLEDVQVGQAYAFLLEVPAGQAAAQVSATFYQAGAAAGAAGFEPVASGPLGDWMATPAGHSSYAEYQGCSNEDRSCLYGSPPTSFGIHPGGAFPRFLKGTWVATASGAVLLRLLLNCDVPFYADAQADGCYIDNTYGCLPTADGTVNSRCASELRLTVTPDAYYDQQPDDGPTSGGSGGGAAATQQQQPISGGAERTDTLVVNRGEVEAQALILWQDTPAEHRTLPAPPTVDEMLVSGSEANALLTSMFTVEQQPHVIFPLSIQTSGLSQGSSAGNGKGGHRRQLQSQNPSSKADLTILIRGRAPTRSHLDGAFDKLAQSYGVCMQGPGGTTSDGHFDYKRCSDRQFRSCHADACAGHGGRRLLSPREGEVGEGNEAAQAEIQELRAALAERDSVLAEREALLAEQVTMLAERDTLLAERDWWWRICGQSTKRCGARPTKSEQAKAKVCRPTNLLCNRPTCCSPPPPLLPALLQPLLAAVDAVRHHVVVVFAMPAAFARVELESEATPKTVERERL
jgi:hypothetical protein